MKMSRRASSYRSLRGQRFTFSRNTWLAADHLLLIKSRLFREYYARIYWTDIQAVLLYSLHRPRGFMFGFELLCVLAAAISAPFVNLVSGSVFGALFVAYYTCWRLTRPNWACQVSTKISTNRFPLAATLASSRRIVEQIKTQALSAQESEPLTTHGVFIGQGNESERKPSKFIVHILTFTLGLFTPLHTAVLAIYVVPLVALYFFERDFHFPFAIRSATVMSQILAALQILGWLASLKYPLLIANSHLFRPDWEFNGLRILFNLFGLAAIYQQSVDRSKYQPQSSTVLGLS